APRAEVVLQRHRNAGQRAGIRARLDLDVHVGGQVPRRAAHDVVEGVDLLFDGVDDAHVLLEHVDGRVLAGPHVMSRVDGGALHQGASLRMRGTRKRPSSAAGAWLSTSSRSRLGSGTSSRNTFCSGSGWAVGGTSWISRAATSLAWSSTAPSWSV